jgi:hypothetical protein
MKLLNFSNNKKNELLLIGSISILLGTWILLYLIPNIFVDLFNTILGKAILILIVMLVSFKNLQYGMILLVIFVIIYRFMTLSIYANNNTTTLSNKIREGFSWNQTSTEKFLEIQNLINPEIVFNTPEIQRQSTQEEVDYFNKYRKWPWSEEVKNLYKEALGKNPYVRTDPDDAVNTVSSIYNENAILQMLSWQTKEGQFLLNGVTVNTGEKNSYEDLPSGWGDYAYKSGQITKKNDVIKCGYKKNNNNEDNNVNNINNNNNNQITLQRIKHMGNEGILNSSVQKIDPVDYHDLEKLIPGFSFLKEPCDPCEALNKTPNYKCQYSLNIKDTEKGISPVWKYLWSKN